MDYAKIESAVESAATDNDAFLVELELKPNNIIVAFVDSDNGLTIEQIKMINRQIESDLDRDAEDFNLTVSSPDLNRPLKTWRQYKKNVGRYLKVKFNERQEEGMLMKVEAKYLVLSVPNKKKSAPNTELEIQFADIAEAKVAIRFK
ncbi:ribosome assembly cofactor RimP [Schleiferiaceae bacterium]|jgi:ribosome maturation factor RimP|nr:ribosome assembly cofactor RimP [Schleiferiaceae bacterium]MDB3991777.1 ribosome assembly cofactor RimP [Schleiferiaceae bacterium]